MPKNHIDIFVENLRINSLAPKTITAQNWLAIFFLSSTQNCSFPFNIHKIQKQYEIPFFLSFPKKKLSITFVLHSKSAKKSVTFPHRKEIEKKNSRKRTRIFSSFFKLNPDQIAQNIKMSFKCVTICLNCSMCIKCITFSILQSLIWL